MSPASQSMPKARHLRQLMPIESPDFSSFIRETCSSPDLTVELPVGHFDAPGGGQFTARFSPQHNQVAKQLIESRPFRPSLHAKIGGDGLMKTQSRTTSCCRSNLELEFNEKTMKRKGRPTGKTLLPTGGAVVTSTAGGNSFTARMVLFHTSQPQV